ncbi:hypothetical protein [Streptomyces sp. NPDC001978]|uniref:hypothetical protein n=1 Tax=Streptomyces sp. NPDC001978 TaxID=3364627 RepID=UPI003680E2FF
MGREGVNPLRRHVSARPRAQPSGDMAVHSLSKAAPTHLIRVLELQPQSIRVHAVEPRPLDTPETRAAFPHDPIKP